jgi:hypothetical protein
VRTDILALLEAEPMTAGQLAQLLDVDRGTVLAELKAMQKAGLIWRHDGGVKGVVWSIVSVEIPERPAPKSGETPLRHPYERPEHVTLSAEDRKPSWWVGLTREQLAAEVAKHQRRMHDSKAAHLMPIRMLR